MLLLFAAKDQGAVTAVPNSSVDENNILLPPPANDQQGTEDDDGKYYGNVCGKILVVWLSSMFSVECLSPSLYRQYVLFIRNRNKGKTLGIIGQVGCGIKNGISGGK